MNKNRDTNSLKLDGLKVNHLTVIERTDERRGSSVKWLCECVCGKKFTVTAHVLKAGKIKSCGCKTKEILRAARMRHGQTYSPEWNSWSSMLERCHSKSHKSYADYGGRGIRVPHRWMHFEYFLEDMGKRPKGTTLERIDNNKDYGPDNCRWATPKEQASNRRNSRVVEHNGKSLTVCQWADLFGIPRDTFIWRLNNGWGMDKATTTPLKIQRNSRDEMRRQPEEVTA